MERRNIGNDRVQLLPEPERIDTRKSKYTIYQAENNWTKLQVKDITIALKEQQEPRCKKKASNI